MTDVRRFWEEKIRGWEAGRYASRRAGPMEWLADRASDSLRFRLQIAGELLAPHVRGKRVLDLGCGSGLLTPALLRAGAAHVTGVDIAASAIEAATQAAKAGQLSATYVRASLSDLGPVEADVVVSLGLTDWLTDEELRQMSALTPGAPFLHAFSERQQTPAQWLHRAYCWTSYGWRTGGYLPRYFSAAELAACSPTGSFARVWRHPRLSFGALLTTLPIDGAEPL